MDTAPVVSMDALWPELAEQRRPFEVVVAVTREDGGEPLVPRALPPEVLGCWSADQVVASVTVNTAAVERRRRGRGTGARTGRSAGAVVTVRAAKAADTPILELAQPGIP